MTSKEIAQFRKNLLAWFKTHHRKLPWRETKEPYRIWISEVMLQQTQVDRVVPKYIEFLEQFPNWQALAQTSPGAVIRAWASLGYNRRAVRLQAIARQVMERGRNRASTCPLCDNVSLGYQGANGIADLRN